MNRSSLSRKPLTAVILVLAAAFLAGCASHYPYSGGSGVYYGKSHDSYGHGYKRSYGHTGYRYNYYRRDYVHRYVPVWFGYGRHHYSRPHYRDHDRGHDRDTGHGHDRDTAHRSGDAVRELRRVDDQQRRRALLQRSNEPPRGTIRTERPRRQKSEPASSRSSGVTNSARERLRRTPSDRGNSGGRSGSASRGGARTESRPKGGIRSPENRRR